MKKWIFNLTLLLGFAAAAAAQELPKGGVRRPRPSPNN